MFTRLDDMGEDEARLFICTCRSGGAVGKGAQQHGQQPGRALWAFLNWLYDREGNTGDFMQCHVSTIAAKGSKTSTRYTHARARYPRTTKPLPPPHACTLPTPHSVIK